MRSCIYFFVAVLLSLKAFGQNFEGEILYTNTFKSKTPQVTSDQWLAMLGSSQEYWIKGGDYKTISNGSMLQWQLYLQKDNKSYVKMSNSEKALWSDASIQGDEVTKATLNKGVLKVLGYSCDEVILICKSGVQKYYFNSSLSVDPTLFAQHKYGNWYDYVKMSKAVPLKMVIETAQFVIESTATEVKPLKLTKELFELPKGIQTEKSPY
jgi:hypothetical protein